MRRPEFADRCDWSKLKPLAWRQLRKERSCEKVFGKARSVERDAQIECDIANHAIAVMVQHARRACLMVEYDQ